MKNSKLDYGLDSLRSRQDYLVVQGNSLAKAFGNLTAFEHKLLDFCFSFVGKDSNKNEIYKVTALDVIHHFGLNASGKNYKRIYEGFHRLNIKTALLLPCMIDGEEGIISTHLFDYIYIKKDGNVLFHFSESVAPLVYELKSHFYSFKLSELSTVKSKYSLILLKLWESHRYGDSKTTTIQGTLDEWRVWFLGQEGPDGVLFRHHEGSYEELHSKWPAGRFKQKVLEVASKELETKLNASIHLETITIKRKVIGYEMRITDNRQYLP